MRALVCVLLGASFGLPIWSATTVNPSNKFAYGANIGWLDWRGDTNNGAVIGEFVCSGFIYAANVGWINLGSGAPVSGSRYQNNSATNSGVNHDGAGNLYGFAWGANIGWLVFTNRDAAGAPYEGPKVEVATGRLSGFIYGPNIGWISLSNAFAYVQTDPIPSGADTDGDGIPDAWERQYGNNLATLTAGGDADGDGSSDHSEYLADTSPLDPTSSLRITLLTVSTSARTTTIGWTSRSTRSYQLQTQTGLRPELPWMDSGLGVILPDSGASTTRVLSNTPSAQGFYRIQLVVPGSP